jgi:tRNA threonylcarbamoyladenosine biosynthesis protein TsaB
MRILALECSTTAGGVAILDETRLVGSVGFDASTLYSQRLLPSLEWLMARCEVQPASITGIAISIGPGSFTGLRIGLSAAKALAYAWDVPVVAIGTMEALALRAASGFTAVTETSSLLETLLVSAADEQGTSRVCTLLDARQGEVFAGLYEVCCANHDVDPLHVAHGGSLDDIKDWIDRPVIFAGDAALKQRDKLAALFGDHYRPARILRNLPSAEEVALLGLKRLLAGQSDDLMTLEPEYLRRSYTGA